MPTIYDNYEEVMSQIIETPVTSSYVAAYYTTYSYIDSKGYVTSVPVIDENIIPKETATYTLGNGSHIYRNTYSRGVYLGTGIRMFSESSASSNDMAISLGGVSYFYLNTNRFAPNGAANNEKLDLGTADRKWNGVYCKSINATNAYISSATYLPVNTYWWDGTSYHWLGSLFS